MNFDLQLFFYSTTPGRTVLHPQSGNTCPPGNGAEKRRVLDPGFLPRWYAYVNDQAPEPRIAARPIKYQARIDSRHLYDIEGDVDNYRDFPRYADVTYLESALEKCGFQGYWSPARGVAVLFVSLPCHQIAHERDLFGEAQEV